MHSFKFLPSFLTLLGLVSWAAAISSPMKTSGRWIVDANNQRVKLRCVNWAGHMEMHIPEGLQHQPINTITAWIASNGFNCVRLTYSVDMAINPDVMVADAFTSGGQAAGLTTEVTQGIYQLVQEKNGFVANSTVLDVYQEIIRSLERQNIMVVLDNHVSKASWCCGGADGNGWFSDGTDNANSRFFDVDLWKAGLRNISTMTLQLHPNVIGMSLRNELRPASGQNKGNDEWYRLSEEGANVIHDNNPNLLIVVGGVNYATDSSFLFSRAFNRDAFADKVVWEFHSYMWSYGKDTSTNCASLTKKIGNDVGFLLTENQPYTGPLWLSEFGIDQSISADDRTYMNCLVDYMTGNDADWAVWALQGTYYVRDGQTDLSESFGVLNDNWSDWRNPEFKTLLGEMWNVNQGI